MQDFRPRLFLWGWLCGLMIMAGACRKEEAHSELFKQLFKEEAGGTFRGVDLGMDLTAARDKEGRPAKHDDQWGYVYENSLGEKNHYFLEYICRDPKLRKINAIVLNVVLEEKSLASELFSEMESHLRSRYGVADGSLGHLNWRNEEANLMVSLRMLDNKKSISLNFGALQAL